MLPVVISRKSAIRSDNNGLAAIDKRPYFDKALAYGVEQKIIDKTGCATLITDAAKGTIQVADYFGTSHLFTGLDSARRRIVTLVSLYLAYQFDADLAQAAKSLRDNSFLSHSRSGNDLLKSLHALPESTLFDSGGGQTLKAFQDERTLAKPITALVYRKELARRQANAASLSAARWFAQDMRVPSAALESVDAETVIRTSLLNRLEGSRSWPNLPEFAQRVAVMQERLGKNLLRPFKFAPTLIADVPPQHQTIAKIIGGEIANQDIPYLTNPSVALDAAVHALEARYFLRDTGIEDIEAHDVIVSEAWRRFTGGKEDPYSRLTLFVCLAAGVKPKPTLSLLQARALIRQVRQHGFDEAAVPAMIASAAPYSVRAALLTMWNEEFFPEAQVRLLDECDPKLIFALQFLTENCNVEKKDGMR